MEKSKILIVRLSSIGDIIQALSIPRHLREKFPNSEIHWLVRRDNEELLKFNPYVTNSISFDRTQGLMGWLKLCYTLRKENYTHVYDAHNKIRSLILRIFLLTAFPKSPVVLVRNKERLRRVLVFLFKLKFLHKTYNGIDTYISPLKKWGIINDKKGSELFLSPDILKKSEQTLKNLPWLAPHNPVLALAPATAWPKKTWPLKHWEVLIGQILKKTNFNIIVLGGPKDEICAQLALKNPTRIFSLHGKLSLLESAACISFCKTLIAADTGLLHMAEALKKDVIGIWGPTGWGHTYRAKSITLKTNLWCQPCSKDGSGPCIRRPYQKCMVDVHPETVFTTLLNF